MGIDNPLGIDANTQKVFAQYCTSTAARVFRHILLATQAQMTTLSEKNSLPFSGRFNRFRRVRSRAGKASGMGVGGSTLSGIDGCHFSC